jgi:hypothetical protein
MGRRLEEFPCRMELQPKSHFKLEDLNMNRLQSYFDGRESEEEKAGINRASIAPSPRVIGGMSWWKRNKERERFYLLPGMGGKAQRRKNKVFLAWSILAAVVVSFVLAITFFLMNVR